MIRDHATGTSATFKHVLMTGAAAVAVAGFAPAMAQSAPDTKAAAPAAEGEAIVISGYARSITNANRIKELSVSVVEAISAEDVGKLPDVSIADALSRLPGLAVQQSAGRAKYLSIRGFGPDYTTATLNGRMIATVDDNRRFDYGQYPGDLFQEIDVIKTPSADLLNAGLAGTVDLKTYDPLKAKKSFSINVQGQIGQYKALNPESSNKGYKVSAVYIDKFADNTIGVSLGFSAIKDPTQDEHWATGGGSGNYYGPPYGDGTAAKPGLIGPDDIQNYANSNIFYRQTGFGHVVYRPSDAFEMSVDALYTQSKTREYSRGWEMPLAGWSHDTLIPGSEVGTSDGYIQSEKWLVNPVLRNDFNTSDADTFAIGWNTKAKLNDSLHLVLDANYSHAHRHDNTYEIYGGTSFQNINNPPTATITRQSDGTYGVNISGANFADPNQVSLTDPQGWGQTGFNNIPDFTDTIKGLRAELDGSLGGFFKGWEVGVNYSDEKKVSAYSGYFICLPGAAGTSTVGNCGNWPGTNGGPNSVTIPSSIVTGAVSPYGVTGTQIIAVDILAAQALERTAPQFYSSDVARDWTVRERIVTGYAQLNWDGMSGDVRIRGNIGAQLIHTNQGSDGFGVLPGNTVSTNHASTNYTYFLPMLNTSFEVAQSTFVRFGASRTIARAKLDNENASFAVNYCGAAGCGLNEKINGNIPILSGSGGNPYIRPYFSDNVDLAFEKYFAHDQGKIALAGYYKHISNFATQNQNLNTGNINSGGPVSTTTYVYDFSAYTNLVTNPAQLAAGSGFTTLGYASGPINDGSGDVYGFEVSAVVPLKVLTSALDGFGVVGNYANTTSKIKFSNGSSITLPGLSKDVFQAQVYFEKYGFNARASFTHRGSYLGDYQLFSAQVYANETKAQSTLDAQIGYDFKKGPLNGVSIYLQGHNLTNSKTLSYVNNDPNETNIRDQYGSTYLAGMTFKF